MGLIQCMSSFSCHYKEIPAKGNLRENGFFCSQFRGAQPITVARTAWWWHPPGNREGVSSILWFSPFPSIVFCLGSHPTGWCVTQTFFAGLPLQLNLAGNALTGTLKGVPC